MEARATRPIGRTGLRATALGMGGAALGNLYRPIEDSDAERAVAAAWGAGARFFDTAPFYGYGLSERRMGDALRRYPRDAYVLSTKVGRILRPTATAPGRDGDDAFKTPMPFEPVYDYSYDGVMRSVEDSLQRLGLGRIDLGLIHDIGAMTHGSEAHPALMKTAMEGGYRALDELRSDGTIAAVGLGVNEWAVCAEAMDHGAFDCFLLAGRYTLLEQSALDSFLPRCERNGVSIILGGPYNSGILAVGAQTGAPYDYAAAPGDVLDRVARLEAVCADHGIPLAAAAIQFPLHHPVVCSVIPGAANDLEAARNAELLALSIPPGLWRDLKSAGLLDARAPVPNS